MAMSADLGPALEKVVNDLVEHGRYNSKSEVLREGVRLVEEREARRAVLATLIEEGEEEIAAGRVYPAEQVFAELIARYEAMEKKSG